MKVNGESISLKESCNLEHFLLEHNYILSRIAVERNGEIVSKNHYKEEMLQDDDILLIVHFVGGG